MKNEWDNVEESSKRKNKEIVKKWIKKKWRKIKM